MFGRPIEASTKTPRQVAPSPDRASANRDLGDGDSRRRLEQALLWRRGLRAEQDAQRASVQHLAERAAQLEQAAERFRLAGDEKLAASFAEDAAKLRRAGG